MDKAARSYRRLWRAIRALALVLPLLLAALMPVGVMPGVDQNGQGVLVICSGSGPVLMVFDAASGTYRKAPTQTEKSGCDWANAHPAVVLTGTAAVLPVALGLGRTETMLRRAQWRPAFDPRGMWARGPPASI